MVDLVKLEELAKAATPLDLSSAEKVRDDYEITCPVCDGEGEILAKDWCNIDDQAIGVQVYGIGEKMTAMERFIDAANPATILELLAEIERLREALKVFGDAFENARSIYVKRYGADDEAIGESTFDGMPDEWKMPNLVFTMGDLRRAAALIREQE